MKNYTITVNGNIYDVVVGAVTRSANEVSVICYGREYKLPTEDAEYARELQILLLTEEERRKYFFVHTWIDGKVDGNGNVVISLYEDGEDTPYKEIVATRVEPKMILSSELGDIEVKGDWGIYEALIGEVDFATWFGFSYIGIEEVLASCPDIGKIIPDGVVYISYEGSNSSYDEETGTYDNWGEFMCHFENGCGLCIEAR